ncbi:hypothetical protein QAD02_024343 [Eretmocerus hayati]|uniref:Uncharacterized protein n=1 Tax=Eretmocerus hayati TaxID=131215 RepID=A0ACC2PZI2_9HYME|nr:hypothetical protein QAD02_024343 [Eretmocerus hayati]
MAGGRIGSRVNHNAGVVTAGGDADLVNSRLVRDGIPASPSLSPSLLGYGSSDAAAQRADTSGCKEPEKLSRLGLDGPRGGRQMRRCDTTRCCLSCCALPGVVAVTGYRG